mmetsp:Transcript_13867/g.37029  ORF Transcript_13867/g.37029 Transcript_13867/m.37029 type:complete len:140 (-) Transcript_13867:433-852(-)
MLRELVFTQHMMFHLGAHLATPRTAASDSKAARTAFPPGAAETLEKWIDRMQCELPKITTFVLPGGPQPANAALHLARTICRRAERLITPLYKAGDVEDGAYAFSNRLSDYFFVASRYVNLITGVPDVTWDKTVVPSSM